jgi:hypothetical protein
LTKRKIAVYDSRHVRRRATSLLLLLAVISTAGAARAHVDSLGEPDPYWQQATTAARDARTDVARNDASASPTDALSRLRRSLVYASGGVSLLFLVSLARSLRGSLRRTRA